MEGTLAIRGAKCWKTNNCIKSLRFQALKNKHLSFNVNGCVKVPRFTVTSYPWVNTPAATGHVSGCGYVACGKRAVRQRASR